MKERLPFLNISVKKVLASEQDSFTRAKIQILLTIIICSVVKAILVTFIAIEYGQYLQAYRALFVIVIFVGLVKTILYKPSSVPVVSHIILLAGLVIIWSNLLVYVQTINIITIQLIFMMTLVSYYLIGGIQAAVYTVCAVLPVLYYLVTRNTAIAHFNIAAQVLAQSGTDPVIVLNFITFVITHYLYYRAFHQNLKEKELLNVQLQVNISEAKALAHSRSVFLSTMSHELRTPLNGVIGMAYLLKDNALDEQKEKLDILEFSANNLLSVINDVLDYNKSEQDKIELEELPVNLAALLRKIVSGLDVKAKEKGLALLLELDEKLDGNLVITDPSRLTQIFYNLAGNALKFTDEGIVKISAAVRHTGNEKISVCFTISDTGIGIAGDRQEAIFDPFTQASSDTTRKFGGTGLGLAIVKRLLVLFKSSISLKSSLDKGSVFTFTIEFPLCGRELQPVTNLDTEIMELKDLKLLIAEDNPINTLILEKLLFKWGIQTVSAGNGEEAITKLLTGTFDGVLMDIHMPVMDGYTAARIIRQMADPVKANIPIIALTASVSHQLYAKISDAGMQDYISKPFRPDQLFEKLNHIYGHSLTAN